jgi:parallel beta-helix repeat protein
VVLDGGLRGDVITVELSEHLVIENLVVTRGANGISVRESAHIVLRHNRITRNEEEGIRILDKATTGILVTGNLVEHNRAFGIQLTGNAAAMVTQNSSMANGFSGIAVENGASAEIIENHSAHNGFFGILVNLGSSATITENTSVQNEWEGIVVFSNSTATVTHNTLHANRNNGIVIDLNSTAVLRDNLIVDNGSPPNPLVPPQLPVGSGIIVAGGSVVTISGGVITQNRRHGVHVFVSPLDPTKTPPTARVGLDSDAVIEITDNGGAGILVEDNGSLAKIDSRNIVFDNNAAGDTVGNVCDVAAGPC